MVGMKNLVEKFALNVQHTSYCYVRRLAGHPAGRTNMTDYIIRYFNYKDTHHRHFNYKILVWINTERIRSIYQSDNCLYYLLPLSSNSNTQMKPSFFPMIPSRTSEEGGG